MLFSISQLLSSWPPTTCTLNVAQGAAEADSTNVVMVHVGASVAVLGIPMQEPAEEYFMLPLQAPAYRGTAVGICVGLLQKSGVSVNRGSP